MGKRRGGAWPMPPPTFEVGDIYTITRVTHYIVHLVFGRISLYFECGGGLSEPHRFLGHSARPKRKEWSFRSITRDLDAPPLIFHKKNEEAVHALWACAVTVISGISSGICNPDTCVHVDVSGDKLLFIIDNRLVNLLKIRQLYQFSCRTIVRL